LRKALFASLDAQYRGRVTTFAGASVSPFAVVNVALLNRNLGKHLDISGGVYNLFDAKYSDPPSTAVSLQSIKQDGRSFQLKVAWKSGVR